MCADREWSERRRRYDEERRLEESQYRPDIIKLAWAKAKDRLGDPATWDANQTHVAIMPAALRASFGPASDTADIDYTSVAFHYHRRDYPAYRVEWVVCESIQVWERVSPK